MNYNQIGRAVIRLYLHARTFSLSLETVALGVTIKAGRAMDFAERIRRRGSELSHNQIITFARLVGLDESDLRLFALPTLRRAGVIEYSIVDGQISIEEYVGVSAPLLDQVASTWQTLGPSETERCALESVELATSAPLLETDHYAALEMMGFSAETRIEALTALQTIGIIQRTQPTSSSDEPIIYNEYVWGNGVVSIARFLANLPTNEREILTSISASAIERPGISLTQFDDIDPSVISSARKVGFLDATRVVTSTGSGTSFAFSPTLERGLPITSTDVLHERKLFVAHILFGHRNAPPAYGRIRQPLVLVKALLRKGEVGPATAISSDYPLLESHGIVKVKASSTSGQAYLSLVKPDVVEESLPLLEAALGGRRQRKPQVSRSVLSGCLAASKVQTMTVGSCVRLRMQGGSCSKVPS